MLPETLNPKLSYPHPPSCCRTLVYNIRNVLANKGMEQNPCLEGTEEAADEPFFYCTQCVEVEA